LKNIILFIVLSLVASCTFNQNLQRSCSLCDLEENDIENFAKYILEGGFVYEDKSIHLKLSDILDVNKIDVSLVGNIYNKSGFFISKDDKGMQIVLLGLNFYDAYSYFKELGKYTIAVKDENKIFYISPYEKFKIIAVLDGVEYLDNGITIILLYDFVGKGE